MSAHTPRLRLVKVVVQATLVLDDGESLTEHVTSPVTLSASEWPTYATETFPEQLTLLEQQLLDQSGHVSESTDGDPG